MSSDDARDALVRTAPVLGRHLLLPRCQGSPSCPASLACAAVAALKHGALSVHGCNVPCRCLASLSSITLSPQLTTSVTC